MVLAVDTTRWQDGGEICLMCHGSGDCVAGKPRPSVCCWCLGQGIVPDIRVRLDGWGLTQASQP